MADSNLVKRSLARYAYGKFEGSHFSDSREKVFVPWNNDEGKNRLLRSSYREAFFHLAGFYQPQINPLYCGVASAVIVLNALRLPLDKGIEQPDLAVVLLESTDGQKIEFRTFSQSTFLGPKTESIKKRNVIEYREKNERGFFAQDLALPN